MIRYIETSDIVHAHEHTRARGGRTYVQTGTDLLLARTASYSGPHSMPFDLGGALFVITEALFVMSIRIHVFYSILPVFYPYSTHFPKLTVFYRIHQERTRIHKNTQEYEHVEEGERHILRK